MESDSTVDNQMILYEKINNIRNLYLQNSLEENHFNADDKEKRDKILEIFMDVHNILSKYLVSILERFKNKIETLHDNFMNELKNTIENDNTIENNTIENTLKDFFNKYLPLHRKYNFLLCGYALNADETKLIESFHPKLTIAQLFPSSEDFKYERDVLEEDSLLRGSFNGIEKNNNISLLSYQGLVLINQYLNLFKFSDGNKKKKGSGSAPKSMNCTRMEVNIQEMRLLFNGASKYLLPEVKYNDQQIDESVTQKQSQFYQSLFYKIYVSSNEAKSLLAYILNSGIIGLVIPKISYIEISDISEAESTNGTTKETIAPVDLQYLNNKPNAVTILCNNVLNPTSDNILSIPNSTSLEIYSYGYSEGFLTRDEGNATIKFDYNKFSSNFASIHAVLEKGSDEIYLYVLNLLCLLLNSFSINSIMVQHMINGDINTILNELISNLANNAFTQYCESLGELEITSWDPPKKSNEKQTIRKRFSYAINSILVNITYNVRDNNLAHIFYLFQNTKIKNDSNSKKQEELLLSNLVTIFNKMEPNKRVEILSSYGDNWMMTERSNVLITDFNFYKRTRTQVADYNATKYFGDSSVIKVVPPKKIVAPTNVDKKQYTVHGIYNHMNDKVNNIMFEVDWGPQHPRSKKGSADFWTPYKPSLCRNIFVFDYLRSKMMENLISQEFRTNSIIKFISFQPRQRTKSIHSIKFSVQREFSHIITEIKYAEIIKENDEPSIALLEKYIKRSTFLTRLVSTMDKVNEELIKVVKPRDDDDEEDDDDDDNKVNKIIAKSNSKNEDDKDSEEDDDSLQRQADCDDFNFQTKAELSPNKTDGFIGFLKQKSSSANASMKKWLNSAFQEFESVKQKRVSFKEDHFYNHILTDSFNLKRAPFCDILNDFTSFIERTNINHDYSADAVDFKKLLEKDIKSIIKENQYKLSDYGKIVLQDSLFQADGILSQVCTKITYLKYYEFTKPLFNKKPSQSDIETGLDSYKYFIENLIHLINANLFDSFSHTIFLPLSFIDLNLTDLRGKPIYLRMTLSDVLVFVVSNQIEKCDLIIRIEFKSTEPNKASISIFAIHDSMIEENFNSWSKYVVGKVIIPIQNLFIDRNKRKDFHYSLECHAIPCPGYNNDIGENKCFRQYNVLCGCLLIMGHEFLDNQKVIIRLKKLVTCPSVINNIHIFLLIYLARNATIIELENDDKNLNNDNENKKVIDNDDDDDDDDDEYPTEVATPVIDDDDDDDDDDDGEKVVTENNDNKVEEEEDDEEEEIIVENNTSSEDSDDDNEEEVNNNNTEKTITAEDVHTDDDIDFIVQNTKTFTAQPLNKKRGRKPKTPIPETSSEVNPAKKMKK